MPSLRLAKAEYQRFLSRVGPLPMVEPLACWEWQGARSRGGYGVVRLGRGPRRRLVYAHRLAFALAFGAPGRRVVRHTCDNPACVNPAHLLAGTQADNVRDMIERGRAAWQR